MNTMKNELSQFEQHVVKMWNGKLSFEQSLTNCILGIVGEFFEIIELENNLYQAYDTEAEQKAYIEKVLSELGDYEFYRTCWDLLTVTDTSTEVTMSWNYSDTFTPVSKLLGEIKKYNYHGKELNYENFNQYIKTLNMIVNDISRTFEFDKNRIRLYNIDKLSKRHGTTFQTYSNQK